MEWTDPLHPLPDDILIMKEEEKSCEYCGIPYLLHTEMSRMKRHVQDLEKQLELLKQDRVKVDLEVTHWRQSYEEVQTLTDQLRHEKLELSQHVQQLERNDKRRRVRHRGEVELFHSAVQSVQDMYQDTRHSVQQQIESTAKSSILATQEALMSIQQQYFHLHQTSERQIAALKAETETLQHDLDERIQQVGALEQQVVDGTLQFEQQAHKLRIQLDNQTRLESDLSLTQQKLEESLQESRDLHSLCQTLRGEVSCREVSIQKLEAELEALRLDNKTDQSLALAKVDELLQQLNETQRQRMRESDDKEVVLVRVEQQLSDAQRELKVLEEERSQLIEAHQSRVKDLQDHFTTQLKLHAQTQLQAQLLQQHEGHIQTLETKHHHDLESLEARYQQKLSDLEKKQATLQTEWRRQIADLEKERDQLQEQHRKAYAEKEKEIEHQRITLRQQADQFTQKIQILNEQLHQQAKQHANDLVSQLQQQMENHKKELEQCSRLASTESDEIEKTRSTMKQWEAEMTVLKEVIRRECEERNELLLVIERLRARKHRPSEKLDRLESHLNTSSEKSLPSDDQRVFEQLLRSGRRKKNSIIRPGSHS